MSDAALIELGRELRASWKAELAVYNDLSDDGGREYIAREIESKEIVERIISIPALTAEGMSVKFLAFMWCRGIHCVLDEDFTDTTDARVLGSMARDFLRMESAPC